MIIDPNNPTISSGDVQAAYWNGAVSRIEAQKVYDEYAAVIASMSATLVKLHTAVAFLFEKYGIDPSELNLWLEKKQEEFAASQPQPEPESSGPKLVSLE